MTPEQIVEATLFSSQTALTAEELARADRSLDIEGVEAAIQALRDRYEAGEHAFQIYQLGDGYQILTRPEFAPYLEQFDSVPRSPTLSAAALETLAIIAYRQPIGRVEIEEVRGVSASSVLRTLLEWDLIEVMARGEGLGRPLLYGVSRVFLDHFGFLMDSQESVDSLFQSVERHVGRYGGAVVKVPKRHRDDSYSFYLADPDGNVIQVLYEPTISE